MIRTGAARLVEEPAWLRGRRFGLLAHGASVAPDLAPLHLALAAHGAAPTALFGPEHGYYGVEQDMVPYADQADPWTGAPVRSLYGAEEHTLRPLPGAFDGLDLLIVDLQDVGARYYTYAATAVWAAEAALAAGCEVWILDRPNPLGGVEVEGNLPRPGFESFVGAFRNPVRHGLTLAEIVLLEARRRGWPAAPRVFAMQGWRRDMTWEETGLPWIAPSPNIPTPQAARVYPGMCLIEGTEVSEGRGTTRPFLLCGAPGVDPVALARRLIDASLAGVTFLPTYFKPLHQKHRGEACGGVELVITDPEALRPFRVGVEVLAALREVAPDVFRWRRAPYEFVSDRATIDLLSGGPDLRTALENGAGLPDWIASWAADEEAFRRERAEILLYT